MVAKKKILVPIGLGARDLKGLHHAFSLAKRIPAVIFVLKFEPAPGEETQTIWLDETLSDLVNTARQAGLAVSYYTVQGGIEEEVIGFMRDKEIDLLVIGEEGEHLERALLQMRSPLPSQILRVKKKGRTNKVVSSL